MEDPVVRQIEWKIGTKEMLGAHIYLSGIMLQKTKRCNNAYTIYRKSVQDARKSDVHKEKVVNIAKNNIIFANTEPPLTSFHDYWIHFGCSNGLLLYILTFLSYIKRGKLWIEDVRFLLRAKSSDRRHLWVTHIITNKRKIIT